MKKIKYKKRSSFTLNIVLGLLVFCFLLSGCQTTEQERYQNGNHSKPIPSDYIYQMQKIISQSVSQMTYLAEAKTALRDKHQTLSFDELVAQTQSALKESASAIDKLEKIQPPQEYEEQYKTILTEFIKLEGALEELKAAAERNDYALVKQHIERALIVTDAITAAAP